MKGTGNSPWAPLRRIGRGATPSRRESAMRAGCGAKSGGIAFEVIPGEVNFLDFSKPAERLQGDAVEAEDRALSISGGHIEVVPGHQRLDFVGMEHAL